MIWTRMLQLLKDARNPKRNFKLICRTSKYQIIFTEHSKEGILYLKVYLFILSQIYKHWNQIRFEILYFYCLKCKICNDKLVICIDILVKQLKCSKLGQIINCVSYLCIFSKFSRCCSSDHWRIILAEFSELTSQIGCLNKNRWTSQISLDMLRKIYACLD